MKIFFEIEWNNVIVIVNKLIKIAITKTKKKINFFFRNWYIFEYSLQNRFFQNVCKKTNQKERIENNQINYKTICWNHRRFNWQYIHVQKTYSYRSIQIWKKKTIDFVSSKKKNSWINNNVKTNDVAILKFDIEQTKKRYYNMNSIQMNRKIKNITITIFEINVTNSFVKLWNEWFFEQNFIIANNKRSLKKQKREKSKITINWIKRYREKKKRQKKNYERKIKKIQKTRHRKTMNIIDTFFSIFVSEFYFRCLLYILHDRNNMRFLHNKFHMFRKHRLNINYIFKWYIHQYTIRMIFSFRRYFIIFQIKYRCEKKLKTKYWWCKRWIS